MTNQASEDKIEEELQAIFDGYDGFIDHEYQGTAYDRTDAINAIKAIIRTEKLKLLDKIVGIASNKQFKDYTKQDIASFFSRLGELERELEAEL